MLKAISDGKHDKTAEREACCDDNHAGDASIKGCRKPETVWSKVKSDGKHHKIVGSKAYVDDKYNGDASLKECRR